MRFFYSFVYRSIPLLLLFFLPFFCHAQKKSTIPRVIAFYTAKEDRAHISFVHEANTWFPAMAAKYHFLYDSTSNWDNLNAIFLARYQLIIFLDTRPEQAQQRAAFQQYMEQGGAWMGFHFAAFALTPSAVPQNWHWYHDMFIGAGQYKSNTWRPAAAMFRVEDTYHPAMKHVLEIFTLALNEWNCWERDLRL